jgi:hypothetical protein
MNATLAPVLIAVARSATTRADLVAWVNKHRPLIDRLGDLSEHVLAHARARFKALPEEMPEEVE